MRRDVNGRIDKLAGEVLDVDHRRPGDVDRRLARLEGRLDATVSMARP